MSTSTVTERVLEPINSTKCCYQADQQAKLMHLQAEIDCLFQELQSLKMQRSTPADNDEK
jgi:hypothetical protein